VETFEIDVVFFLGPMRLQADSVGVLLVLLRVICCYFADANGADDRIVEKTSALLDVTVDR